MIEPIRRAFVSPWSLVRAIEQLTSAAGESARTAREASRGGIEPSRLTWSRARSSASLVHCSRAPLSIRAEPTLVPAGADPLL